MASATVFILVACSSNDDEEGPPPPDGGDRTVPDSSSSDAGNRRDANADADADADDDDGGFVVPDATVTCATTPCATKLVGNSGTFCAVLSDGRAACWGENSAGQAGADPDLGKSVSTPTIIEGLSHVTILAVNGMNACARLEDGKVHCWGDPKLIGDGMIPRDGEPPPSGAVFRPKLLDALPPVKDVSLGLQFGCAVSADGSLSCWGANARRELGRGRTKGDRAPAGEATLLKEKVASVVAGSARTFVVTPGGAVLSWGANTQYGNEYFMLGRDTSEDPNEQPTIVPLLSRVRSLSSGNFHSCAVSGRFVECWGTNSSGQLGRGNDDNACYEPAPSSLAAVTDAEDADASNAEHDIPISVVQGWSVSCSVLGSGRVYCWGGAGGKRVLGERVKAYAIRGTPTKIEGLSGQAVSVAATNESVCALLRSGAVECWGGNDHGELGVGAIDQEAHPVPVRVRFPQ